MDKSEQILELIKKLDSNMAEMKSDMNEMKSDINIIKSEINDIKFDIKVMKPKINNLEFSLENVTNKNIKIVAEGHLDLSNKLDSAMKINNEKELLLVRLNFLENEVSRIKTRLEEIA